MQTNLLWTGREYNSLESCIVGITSTGAEITSTIIGKFEGKIGKVEYFIRTNEYWETVLLEIHSRHSDKTQSIRLKRDRKGNWGSKDVKTDHFQECNDVDISLTPFTNTLPIKRLRLGQKESKEIQVIYCDVLLGEIKPVRQKYTGLSPTEYHFENVPNDFEATIKVDEMGFVVDYPSLFVREAALITHYR